VSYSLEKQYFVVESSNYWFMYRATHLNYKCDQMHQKYKTNIVYKKMRIMKYGLTALLIFHNAL